MATYLGRDSKHFQELMGRGGLTGFGPKPVQTPLPVPENKHESGDTQVSDLHDDKVKQ